MVKKAPKRDIILIDEITEKKLDFTTKYRYDDIKIDSSNIDLCYLIIHIDKLASERKLTYEEVLLLIYLYELGVFSNIIELSGNNTMSVYRLEKKGYIESDYVNNNKLYSLSAAGIILVKDFLKKLSDNDKIISKNRKAIMDDDSRTKSVLSRFFNS